MMDSMIAQDRKLHVMERRASARRLQNYFLNLWNLLCRVEATDINGKMLKPDEAVGDILLTLLNESDKVIFIGNGGSAAIASHMAADFLKNGDIKAMSLNDPAVLTCLSNDLGYGRVFAKQIEMHANENDMLVAISSSGRSTNILHAVDAAQHEGCHVVTMTGFDEDNPLRQLGRWNFYVPSSQYGPVEIAHLTLCHGILDRFCIATESGYL